jgi:hypothetical protein
MQLNRCILFDHSTDSSFRLVYLASHAYWHDPEEITGLLRLWSVFFANSCRRYTGTHRVCQVDETDRRIVEASAIDLRRKMRNLEAKMEWTHLV